MSWKVHLVPVAAFGFQKSRVRVPQRPRNQRSPGSPGPYISTRWHYIPIQFFGQLSGGRLIATPTDIFSSDHDQAAECSYTGITISMKIKRQKVFTTT